MSLIKAAVLGTTGILGAGSTVTAGAYCWTYETIGYSLSDSIVPDLTGKDADTSLDSVWSILKSKIPEENNVKTDSLKEIKKNTSNQETSLRDWCFKSYKSTYRDLFYGTNENLKSDVKAVCIITIKDKLGENTLLKVDDSQKDEYIKNLDLLNQESLGANLNLKSNTWEDLRNWCKETYEKGYQGENTNRVKLVNKLCKKQQQ